MYDIAIIGNGSIGLAIAKKFSESSVKNFKISIFGDNSRIGSASKAAGLMFAGYSEIDEHFAKDEIEKKVFNLINKKSNSRFEREIKNISKKTKIKLRSSKKTFIINNNSASNLDEVNFEAIIQSLKKNKEKFKIINPLKIPGYKPEKNYRSQKSIAINENSIDARKLLGAIDLILSKNKNCDVISNNVNLVNISNGSYKIVDDKKNVFYAKKIILCAGPNSQKFFTQLKVGNIQKLFYGTGHALILKSNKKHNFKSVIRTVNRGLGCGVHIVPIDKYRVYVGATNRLSHKEINQNKFGPIKTLLLSAVREINTDFENFEIEKILTGHRCYPQDGKPLMGKIGKKNIYIATGFKRIGFTQSFIIADMIFNNIVHNKIILKELSPTRKIIKQNKKKAIENTVNHMLSAAYQHEMVLPSFEDENIYKNSIREKIVKIYKEKRMKYGVPPEILNFYKYNVLK